MVTRSRVDRVDNQLRAALSEVWAGRLNRAVLWAQRVDAADPVNDDTAAIIGDLLEATADPTGVKLAGLNPERRAEIIEAAAALREILETVKAREILRAEAVDWPAVGRIAKWT